jgi:hypothetical protein
METDPDRAPFDDEGEGDVPEDHTVDADQAEPESPGPGDSEALPEPVPPDERPPKDRGEP